MSLRWPPADASAPCCVRWACSRGHPLGERLAVRSRDPAGPHERPILFGPLESTTVTASRLPCPIAPALAAFAFVLLAANPAQAEEPASADDGGEAGVSTTASISLGEGSNAEANTDAEGQRWIDKFPPEPMMLELGIYGGVFFPSPIIELFEPDLALPDQGRKQFSLVAPDIGLRAGFYPLRHFGVEAEGGAMFGKLREGGSAQMWHARGHLVGQIGLWRLTPFVVAGAGAIGVASPRDAVGSEADIAVHFGAGLKFFINYWLLLRLDLRDNLTNKIGVGEGVTHSPEILLGLSVTLNRHEDRPLRDRDGDGIPDRDDMCPREPGPAPTGCPPDADKDAIPDEDDACPDQPETRNGYDDDDGCPDVVPEEFASLAGILEGINFDTDKDIIKRDSKPILDAAVETLEKFPQVHIEISGHTDSRGGYEHNMDLSQRRAESVRNYLVEAGIDEARIETRGAGPNEPIDTNDTSEGRANNRRIEVKILTH
ncbi:OmpA family protein [Pseudenhygromyxa sp. WMMC2535]|uniref:OmpA family protein n=1 Tax=Pseudenhygromyxa sp. WMMC2535 TaxID=2712867 RepID=UPI0015953A8F|nr:OmpA family protein [Pseudenhygromyxa sp. WMMC2535]